MRLLRSSVATVVLAALLLGVAPSPALAGQDYRGWVYTSWSHTGSKYYAKAKGYAGEVPATKRSFRFDKKTVYKWASNENESIRRVSRTTYWSRIRKSQKRGEATLLTFVRRTDSHGKRYWYVKQACGGIIGE